MDWISFTIVALLFIGSFVLGTYWAGSRWEARYIPAIMVVNAAFNVVLLLRKHDKNSIVDPPTVLALEQGLDHLEAAVDEYAKWRNHDAS